MIKTLLCAAAVVAAPVVASATVVEPGDFGSVTQALIPGSATSFFFDPTEETTFSFTVSGTGLVSDVTKLSFGYSPISGTQSFSEVVSFGPIGIGVGMLESVTTELPFYVYFFDNGAASTTFLTMTYTTEAIAPVPLPAAGGLMLLALGGLGVAAARRRK